MLPSHSQVSLHFAAHAQVSLSLSPLLSQGLCYLQEGNAWNNSEADVNFLNFICKWRHSITFTFSRFTSTLNILETQFQHNFVAHYSHQCDSYYLPSTAPKYFHFEREPEWCLQTHGEYSEHDHLKVLMGSWTAPLRPGVPKWCCSCIANCVAVAPEILANLKIVPKYFKNILNLLHAPSTSYLVCCLQNCNKLLQKRIPPDQEHDFTPALALETGALTWRESSSNGKSRATSINTAQLETTCHKPNKQSYAARSSARK